jgi:RNA polymerase sigma-70 factor (ECF subfamily)
MARDASTVSAADARAALERKIRRHCDAGEKRRAATVLLEGYGREIFGFLVTRLRDHDAASEAFSRFSEDLWKGLDGFAWRCSARVWSYTLARHAASHYLREVRRRRQHNVPLSRADPLSEIEERIRTATLASARTASRSRIAELRESLPIDDQTLLVLRINRRLAWTEIAQVMFHEGEVVDDSVLEKESVKLRKRYQSAKDKLRKMAVEAGLAPAREGD